MTQRKRWTARTTACALAISMLVTMTISSYVNKMPTTFEMEVAKEYGLDVWSRNVLPQLREAQKWADAGRMSMIHRRDQETDTNSKKERKHLKLQNAIKKISHVNIFKPEEQYMDVPEGCEATVLIVRHCEKGRIREHCAYVGFERSVYLATLFGDEPQDRWPLPNYIFAEGPGGRNNQVKMNFREIETVGPVARKSNVTIDDSYTTKTKNNLANQILTQVKAGQMCGKVALISWKHSNIGPLAHRLGCGPAEGCPLDYRGRNFDMVWQIKYTYRSLDHSTRHSLRKEHAPAWHIYGAEIPEGFDPLAFSKKVGDYPPEGTAKGARWQSSAYVMPERRSIYSNGGWRATHVDLEGKVYVGAEAEAMARASHED